MNSKLFSRDGIEIHGWGIEGQGSGKYQNPFDIVFLVDHLDNGRILVFAEDGLII